MKQFKILFALAGLTFGMAVGLALAHAQQAPTPTVQSTQEDANRAISVLQDQRNSALDQAAAARIATAKVQSELAAEKKENAELRSRSVTAPLAADPAK